MIYRDDDINRFTDIATFLKIHDLFIKYNQKHLCVIEMKDLWENRGLWHLLMTLPNIEIGLHCWDHQDYSLLSFPEAMLEIEKCIKYWRKHCLEGYGKVIPITTFYPTWNRLSDNLKRACIEWGLRIDNRNSGEVFNFHWWEFINNQDLSKLENILKK